MDYKDTLNLPQTDFPMRADLAKKEPEILARWESERLYSHILQARKTQKPYVLHDGPPYANGNIHYGHILNKILKDIVCKYRTMTGRYVEYKPGWDTHGLPIELAVLRDQGDKAKTLSPIELRTACAAYAKKWVDVQRDEFKRLGVFGTWEAPYLTLDKTYEATIVRQLAGFAEKNILYRDRKPVHWCMTDRTALAEAEIEYDEKHTSPSIYVAFALPEKDLYAVIWTTTPWTLPANHAIAYHPEFDYVIVHASGRGYVVADKLADAFVKMCALTEDRAREPFATERFAKLRAARHPFYDRDSLLLAADYVTLDQGTGLVHTAPGHGTDDYRLGKQNGLPIDAPVDDAGRMTSIGDWNGKKVFEGNPLVIAELQKHGALVSPPTLSVTHAYPICWRCKKPVIFRATWQWFAALDDKNGHVKSDLRKVALAQIERTEWIPPWGKNRISGMIENRPDWVLSRQRAWGVPIPVLYKEDGTLACASGAFMRKVGDLFETHGADAWFTRSAEEFGKLAGLSDADAKTCVKGGDIVDVWFESGVSAAAVCAGKPGLSSATPNDPRYVDLYLEGSDQHRGWFHSSLLVGAANDGHAPYHAVLTHGFVLDERGKPYSKSEIEKARREGIKIEFIPPADVLKQQGAELLRLWAAQADFRTDIAYSRNHLVQLGESYRKIRNTCRYLLGNLHGFNATTEHKPENFTDLLDQYMYNRVGDFAARVHKAYDLFEFHAVFHAIVEFCSTDLSALYCDIRKDRLYCDKVDSPERKNTQLILQLSLEALATAMAPILCFTAEEIWAHMQKVSDAPPSVHLALLGKGWAPLAGIDDSMQKCIAMRQRVHKELEAFRAQKKASLDAAVTLALPKAELAALVSRPDVTPAFLADFFIVSQVTLIEGAGTITVAEAVGHKCERCWKWTPDAPICTRCQKAIVAHE